MNQQQAVPRIRGKAHQNAAGRWWWEILITFMPDKRISHEEIEIQDPITLNSEKSGDTWATKSECIEAMRGEIPKLMGIIGDAMKCKVTEYTDLHTMETKPL